MRGTMNPRTTSNTRYADVAVMTSQFDADGVEKLVISCFPRLKDGKESNSGLHEFTRAVVLTYNSYQPLKILS